MVAFRSSQMLRRDEVKAARSNRNTEKSCSTDVSERKSNRRKDEDETYKDGADDLAMYDAAIR
jgi:hypothetical protein